MNGILERIKMWEYLKTETSKIYDPKTRSLYYRAFLARASTEWGFNPETPATGQKKTVISDDWEKDFAQDIQDTISYGLDVREDKRKEQEKQTRQNMREFILSGGELKDIPDDIRTHRIIDIYLDEMFKIGDNLAKCADDLIKRTQND